LFAREAEFLRTPKTAGEAKWWDAIRGNIGETVLAVLGIAAIAGALTKAGGYGGILTACLLLWPTAAFAGAPLNSLSAQRAALPEELRRRRATENRRYRTARRATFAVAGLAGIGASVAVALALLSPGGSPSVTPQLVGPARGHPEHYNSTSSSRPAAPAGSGSAPVSGAPASGAGGSGAPTGTPTAPSSAPAQSSTASSSAAPSSSASSSASSSSAPASPAPSPSLTATGTG
jgi:hypothetical protein